MNLFLLSHVIDMGSYDREKRLGVFSSHENAERAIEIFRDQPGFRDFPKLLGDPVTEEEFSGFRIDEYTLDEYSVFWSEGFGVDEDEMNGGVPDKFVMADPATTRFSKAFTKYSRTKQRIEDITDEIEIRGIAHVEKRIEFPESERANLTSRRDTFARFRVIQARACLDADDQLKQLGLPSDPTFDRTAAETDANESA